MPPAPAEVRSAAAPAPGEASATVRGIISYLIFLHFFFLMVGIKANTSSSGLDQDLRNKVPGLRQYLQITALDSSYMFHLTHYNDESSVVDTDYFFEADIARDDGSSERVVLQPIGVDLPIRDFRYRRLAFVAGRYAESGNDSLASLLPQALARRLMLEHNSRALTLRLRRRLLLNRLLPQADPRYAEEMARKVDDPASFETVYETRAFMTDDGEVSVAQVKEASDQAAPTPRTPPAPSGTAPTPTATGTAAGGRP